MEDSLYFFLAGFSIFIARLITARQKPFVAAVSFMLFPAVLLASIDIFIHKIVPDYITFPLPGLILFAVFCGFMLYAADKTEFIFKPGIRYFATVFLGFIAAGLAYVIGVALLAVYRIPGPDTVNEINARFLYFLLSGFLFVFGYTFPSRFFKQGTPKKQ